MIKQQKAKKAKTRRKQKAFIAINHIKPKENKKFSQLRDDQKTHSLSTEQLAAVRKPLRSILIGPSRDGMPNHYRSKG